MIYFLKLIAILVSFGLCFQYVLSKIEDAKYPAPGKMVDIGGYRLHIYCIGDGPGPTVVLDMGLGGNMLYWSLVQSEIAKFARVVSYDRAGLGWSDKSPLPRTSQNLVSELHDLLHKAKIPGPYIFVGHSFAGITSRIYANKYPGEVVGVVLVDSSHENQLISKLPQPTDFVSKLLSFAPTYGFVLACSRIGIHRIFHLYNGDSKAFDARTSRIMTAKNSSVKFMQTLLAEWGMFEANLAEVRLNKYGLGDIPLIVITGSIPVSKESCAKYGHKYPEDCNLAYKIWHELQRDLLTKSTNSKQIHAYNSGHIIQKDEPSVIIKAVKDMMQSYELIQNANIP